MHDLAPQFLRQVLPAAVSRLKQAGKPSAALDARLLLEHATGISREHILCELNVPIDDAGLKRFEAYLTRRLRGETISRILGKRYFWKSAFEIAEGVFDPRPESELLVETALKDLPLGETHILDLGTGSGCLLLSLLSERPAWRGIGLDCSAQAIQIARRNGRHLGLSRRSHFLCADWNWGFSGAFDLVLVNPPYIPSDQIAACEPEVCDHDPIIALDGGADGLDDYRCLAGLIGPLLKPHGLLLAEIGLGQAEAVLDIFKNHNFEASFEGTAFCDLNQIPRMLRLEQISKKG